MSLERGKAGEEQAAQFLESNGYQILDRNYNSRVGEIDIIAGRRDVILFVEVKARSSNQFGTGAESVTASKQQKIIKTAGMYLARHGRGRERVRFDVIEIDLSSPDSEPQWIQGAFEESWREN